MNKFIGQWTGTSNSNSFVIVNIGQDNKNLTGRVSVHETAIIDKESVSYWTWSYFKGIINDDNTIDGFVNQPSVHTTYGELFTEENLAILSEKGNITFPDQTNFKGKKISECELEIEWNSIYSTGLERHDKVILTKECSSDSKILHTEMSWKDFKEYALEQKDGFIYRGQAQSWRLQTSFHRTGHADLIDYLDHKIPEVEHHINAYSNHVYNVHDDRSLGALLNLVQHHGYPTPLLDWTKSPYVAAFFAFQDEKSFKENSPISIFIFDDFEWAKIASRNAPLRFPNIIVRTMELPGFGNARMLPQQAITMYSNVDDIESIIQITEKLRSQSFIKAISIPASERDVAMRDLSLMGITWGSMFPGLDGICKQLNSRHFS